MSATELLELPEEFRGLPDRQKRLALDSAQAMLPSGAVLSLLGAADAELALVNAAAHWLVMSGAVDTSVAGIEPMPGMARPKAQKNETAWSGSPYGEIVAAILAKLPRNSGRTRRYPFAT